MDAATGNDFGICTGEMIPAAEIGERDAESVGDGYKRVAATGGVKDHARGCGGWRRLWNDQCIESLKRLGGMNLIGGGELGFGDTELTGDGGESVVSGEVVVAPRVSLDLRNEGDALIEEGGGAGGEMEVECCIRRCDHAQEAGIEGGELVDRGID